MNKRFLFVSSVLFMCFGFILIVYFLLYRPFHVEESYIRIEPVQSAEELVSIKDYIDRNADNGSYQVFCDTNEFPSESYRDYCYILIHFALKNHSPFKTAVNDGYITDMKTINESEYPYLEGTELLVVNALRFTKPHHSHQLVDDAIAFARRVGAKRTLLIHVCHDVGLHEKVNQILPADIQLAYDGQEIIL